VRVFEMGIDDIGSELVPAGSHRRPSYADNFNKGGRPQGRKHVSAAYADNDVLGVGGPRGGAFLPPIGHPRDPLHGGSTDPAGPLPRDSLVGKERERMAARAAEVAGRQGAAPWTKANRVEHTGRRQGNEEFVTRLRHRPCPFATEGEKWDPYADGLGFLDRVKNEVDESGRQFSRPHWEDKPWNKHQEHVSRRQVVLSNPESGPNRRINNYAYARIGDLPSQQQRATRALMNLKDGWGEVGQVAERRKTKGERTVYQAMMPHTEAVRYNDGHGVLLDNAGSSPSRVTLPNRGRSDNIKVSYLVDGGDPRGRGAAGAKAQGISSTSKKEWQSAW